MKIAFRHAVHALAAMVFAGATFSCLEAFCPYIA
jgi:hypothetical protein